MQSIPQLENPGLRFSKRQLFQGDASAQ